VPSILKSGSLNLPEPLGPVKGLLYRFCFFKHLHIPTVNHHVNQNLQDALSTMLQNVRKFIYSCVPVHSRVCTEALSRVSKHSVVALSLSVYSHIYAMTHRTLTVHTHIYAMTHRTLTVHTHIYAMTHRTVTVHINTPISCFTTTKNNRTPQRCKIFLKQLLVIHLLNKLRHLMYYSVQNRPSLAATLKQVYLVQVRSPVQHVGTFMLQ
jgi:hypothetical protein